MQPDPTLTEAAAEAAVSVFQEAGLQAGHEAGAVSVEQLQLEVRAFPEAARDEGAYHMVAVRFEVDVPGVPQGVFTAGVVGAGPTQHMAIASALESWGMVHIAPLADALRGDGVRRTFARSGPMPAIEVAGFEAYVGPMELRSMTETPPGFTRVELLAALQDDLEGLGGEGMHTIDLVRTGGSREVCEVRLDGEVHLGLTSSAATLPVGELTGDWLIKAFVVLRPGA